MGSLQDALLKSGLVDGDDLRRARKKKTPARGKARAGGVRGADSHSKDRRPPGKGEKAGGGKSRGDTNLSRAYAARRKAELAERERQKQARVADQEARRKRNLELEKIVDGKALNLEEAELPRYFEHIGRVRRVLCTPEQREQINHGQLGVISLRGRYLIVEPEILEQYRALAPDLVPDLSGKEPEQPEDDYPPVPDDITW